MLERKDAYRQLRITIDPMPSSGQVIVVVVARTSRGGVHSDRTLARRVFPGDLAIPTVRETISRAGEFLLAIAEQVGPEHRK
jgi:hypothetical protein